MFYAFIFIFGLCVGSFLNVVINRLETSQSIFLTRSHCPQCKAILKWFDLIPVFSFLWLRGRCRYCGQKISWQYPLVELVTGILFVLVVYLESPNLFVGFPQQAEASNLLVTGYWLLVICFLIIIFVYDLKYYLIPDKIIYPVII
jgi:leader peptidase (prepilin peptidase)/N-methyltransferase